MASYYSARSIGVKYLPMAEDIKATCREFQKDWTDKDRREREKHFPNFDRPELEKEQPMTVPVIAMADLC